MAFEELRDNSEEIQDRIKNLVESNLSYYKLWGFKVAMKSTTVFIKMLLMIICVVMILIFLSIAGAFAIGKYYDNYAYGFLIVAGIYFVVVLLLYFMRDSMIDRGLIKKFSEIFYTD